MDKLRKWGRGGGSTFIFGPYRPESWIHAWIPVKPWKSGAGRSCGGGGGGGEGSEMQSHTA